MKLVRGKFKINCKHCNTSFEVYYSWRNRKFCSAKCRTDSRIGKPTWGSINFKKGIQTNTGRTHFKNGQEAWNKGKPAPWSRYDLLFQPEVRKKALERSALVNSKRIGELHPSWKKEDEITYRTLHQWINARLGKAEKCSNNPSHISRLYHWANISGEYKRDLSDWHELCPKCNLTDGVKIHPRFQKGGAFLRT